MKKLAVALFVVFFLCAGFYAVVQSDFARNYLRNRITETLEQSGFTAQIERIEGTLPHQINLKGVSLQGKGVEVQIQTLALRPVLWRFLKKEIAFSQIQAHAVTINQSDPFDFAGRFRMNQRNAYLQGKSNHWDLRARLNRSKNLLVFALHHTLLHAKGQAQLDPSYQLTTAKIQLTSDQLPTQTPGRVLAQLVVSREETEYKTRARWQIPHWDLRGRADVTLVGRRLVGTLTVDPFAQGAIDLAYTPEGLFIGATQLTIENLQALHLPDLYGKLAAKAEWHALDGQQGLHLDATATDFYYGTDFTARNLSLYSDLSDPFHNIQGTFDFALEKGKWNQLELETASLEVTTGEEKWPFTLFAEGKWERPLEIRMQGTWSDHQAIDIASLSGTLFNHPFSLTQPVHFLYTKDQLLLPDVVFAFDEGSASLHIDHQQGRTDARLNLKQMPLDLFSLNPLDVPVNGLLDLEANVQEKNQILTGALQASLSQTAPFAAQGQFSGRFDRDLLNLKGQWQTRGHTLLDLDLSLPIHLSLWPFRADLFYHRPVRGHVVLDGRVEEFLDFVNVGPHRLEGACQCDLTLSNTLNRLHLQGEGRFFDGTYENYYTGTHLGNIQADFHANGTTLFVQSFTAQDLPGSGTLTGHGQIELIRPNLFPFSFDMAFDQLRFAEIDLVTATADGQIHIEGNTTSALAKGDIRIRESELTIPDHIPHPLPQLQVIYRNATHPVPPPETEYRPYPLHLDLAITAPQAVAISGRGLTSTWSGDFHLGGTFTAPAAKGKLDLLDGEFNFSSRSFKLTEGSLSLSGVEHELPYLNIAGSMETKGIAIIARLHGPLNNPQITLQSVPPLPLGSIMSYLLFGQDVSEISGFQALQLATSLASLAGTGPDIMESTRRSLGIDRLRIISDPSEEGGETVALQVGKYISKGVLVTFTQGTEDSSPDISVEFELKGNFVFQIESDQHQEQGVFTLKWNRNY